MTEDELTNLEALRKDAPEDMTEVCGAICDPVEIIYDEAREFYYASRTALPTLIAEVRRLREYVTLLEQAAGTMVQVQRERSAPVFERSTVFSRPECVFKYCASPLDCQQRCMLTKPQPE